MTPTTMVIGDCRVRYPAFLCVVKLTEAGRARVLDGVAGMTFIVDSFTHGQRGPVAHVRDYRYPGDHYPYQIWSIGVIGYEIIAGRTLWAYPPADTDPQPAKGAPEHG
jgi:hypothetical protein